MELLSTLLPTWVSRNRQMSRARTRWNDVELSGRRRQRAADGGVGNGPPSSEIGSGRGGRIGSSSRSRVLLLAGKKSIAGAGHDALPCPRLRLREFVNIQVLFVG